MLNKIIKRFANKTINTTLIRIDIDGVYHGSAYFSRFALTVLIIEGFFFRY